MRSALLALLGPSLGGLFVASPTEAGSLTYSVGVGYIERSFDPTVLISLGASKSVTAHVEVAADVAYLHYSQRVSPTCVGGSCPSSELGTTFIPVSLGLIGYLNGPTRTGPYAEFSPSLCVSRSSAEGGAGSGKFTNVAGGLKAGLGMRLSIFRSARLDLGLLYLLSASGDIDDQTIRALTGEERFEGLRELVPAAKLSIQL